MQGTDHAEHHSFRALTLIILNKQRYSKHMLSSLKPMHNTVYELVHGGYKSQVVCLGSAKNNLLGLLAFSKFALECNMTFF